MHIVEIRRSAVELGAVMAQMRVWLDHQRIEPSLFDVAVSRSGNLLFRLQFKEGHDASTFAAAFHGGIFATIDQAIMRAA